MSDDIVEAHNELDDLSQWESLGHKVHFDPRRFIQEHPEPAMEAFRHSEDELRHWARRCSWVRKAIIERIERARQSPAIANDIGGARTRIGVKLSKPAHNPECMTEERMRKQRQQDQVPIRGYRARRRKTVSLAEQEEIVDAYETGRWRQ